MNKEKIAIIVAGGKGERMQTEIPKQFIEIKGKPILMHTIDVFRKYNSDIQLIVVLPITQIEFWKDLCFKHCFTVKHQIIGGGTTRFHSVKNGLDTVKIPSLIAVHDGVRPLVSTDTIARCFEEAEKNGAAIPVIDLVDSIRQLTNSGSQSVDRNSFKLVQTPQVFDGELLKKAYQQEYSTFFTDDASVVENLGANIKLVDGNRENIKITNGFDLIQAETYLT
ncbi:MAG: 2-C-methyl-D-erythritol 4-phosphate cytidylyltransferase [Paludibacter sp.]